MSFKSKLEKSIDVINSLLTVSLDSDMQIIPEHLRSSEEPFFEFNRSIIEAVSSEICAVKLNSAMYEAEGAKGIAQLKRTCAYLQENYSDKPIVLDCKRGDVGNTNNYYARYAFEYLGVDAITVHPYLGKEANQPFLDYKDKGIIVLCRTSNPGAGEFQDLKPGVKKLYEIVAEEVANKWNENGNCHLVVGATYPKELSDIRKIIGDDMFILAPGLGAQGGNVEKSIKAGTNDRGAGLITVSGRGIIYASSGTDFADAAQKSAAALKEEINKYR